MGFAVIKVVSQQTMSLFLHVVWNYRWLDLSFSVPYTLKVAEPIQECTCMLYLLGPFCEFAVTSCKCVILCII
jgi:hypothetical protein